MLGVTWVVTTEHMENYKSYKHGFLKYIIVNTLPKVKTNRPNGYNCCNISKYCTYLLKNVINLWHF